MSEMNVEMVNAVSRKYEKPMTRDQKMRMIKQVLALAKEITDAGYGHIRFVDTDSVCVSK